MRTYFTIPKEGDLVALMHGTEESALKAEDMEGDTHLAVCIETVDASNARFELPMFYTNAWRCECIIPCDGTVPMVIQGLAIARTFFNHAIAAYGSGAGVN